jgi:AraC family transcriptional regulator
MRRETQQSYHERILRVLVHIQAHLDEPLPLEDLARIAWFSPYHFHRIFRGMVGESLHEHIRRLRLERAAQRLKASDQPVTEIALDAGYERLESFTRAFRTLFGVPPTGFRGGRWPARAPAPSGVHFAPGGQVKQFTPKDTGGAAMQVRMETVAPMRVAFMRYVGPFNGIGATWEKLLSWAGPRGLLGPQTKFLAVWYDDPEVTAPEKLRGDACFTVDERFTPQGEVGAQEVGGGEFAITTHRGPYDTLGDTYARLFGEWLPQSGREPRPVPSFEVYLNNPRTTPPEGLLTDIYVPLEPKRV